MPKTLSDFVEFKAKAGDKRYDQHKFNVSHGYLDHINLKLGDPVDPKLLPYADYYTEEVLRSHRLSRINQCIVLARADTRSPEEILNAGGMHPQFTNTENKLNVLAPRTGFQILSVLYHRFSTTSSGLISCTISMSVARSIALRERNSKAQLINIASPEQKIKSEDLDTYVYMVKAVGAIDTGSIYQLTNVVAEELEYSIPGGVDAEDIIAFRKISKNNCNYDNSIFISKEFLNKHLDKVEYILNAFVQNHEDFSTAFEVYRSNLNQGLKKS